MKMTSAIARYLLGFIFLTFGLNGFLHFIPLPPPTGAAAQQFCEALFVSAKASPAENWQSMGAFWTSKLSEPRWMLNEVVHALNHQQQEIRPWSAS